MPHAVHLVLGLSSLVPSLRTDGGPFQRTMERSCASANHECGRRRAGWGILEGESRPELPSRYGRRCRTVELRGTFDVRASIDLTPDGPDPKIMKSFQCTMTGEGAMWVLENIDGLKTLSRWCLGLQANVYDGTGTGAKNNSGLMLEQYLNSMVMVAGGKDYLLSTPPTSGDGGGDTQGCQAQRTSVPLGIILLLNISTIGIVKMVVYLTILSLTMKSSSLEIGRKRPDSGNRKNVKRETPNSLIGWMTQAVREGVQWEDAGEIVKAENLKLWGFARRQTGVGFGIKQLGRRNPTNYGMQPDNSYSQSAIDERAELTRF